MRVVKWILELLFPSRCVGCGRLEASGICRQCRAKLPYVEENACPKCGRYGKWCTCRSRTVEGGERRHTPRYQQLMAPFYYEGLAREAIKALKFRGVVLHACWIGREMTERIRRETAVEMLDVIVPVPLSRRRFRERGFNQAALLAGEISRELSVPMREDLLVKKHDSRIQHTLSRRERLQNAAGAYEADSAAYGLRILLIDDISTTGATLESCADALYRAGAEAVVCCCAAVTKWKSGDQTDILQCEVR